MTIRENISLKAFNTFGMDVMARYFASFSHAGELAALPAHSPAGKSGSAAPLILGGGSNILFTRNVNGLVLKNEIKGIMQTGEDEEYIYVKTGAGENWHGFVQHCIAHNWAGVENLSLIPGNTGASPMQNIGAYGVEIKDVFHELEAWHLQDRAIVPFRLQDCGFGYRESVFKQRYLGQFAILTVTYRLFKRPRFNTSYGAIAAELEKAGVQELSIRAISDAVIRIRSSKLPDPAITGNAGSFFKNPQVGAEQFRLLQQQFPQVVSYPAENGSVKLAAGWLIEQCGWKGYRSGDAGCHPRQALVLVNYGHASGQEIYDLSCRIQESVKEKFNVLLEREVNIM